MKQIKLRTVGALKRERERESYTLINKKQSMKNALFIIHERGG